VNASRTLGRRHLGLKSSSSEEIGSSRATIAQGKKRKQVKKRDKLNRKLPLRRSLPKNLGREMVNSVFMQGKEKPALLTRKKSRLIESNEGATAVELRCQRPITRVRRSTYSRGSVGKDRGFSRGPKGGVGLRGGTSKRGTQVNP